MRRPRRSYVTVLACLLVLVVAGCSTTSRQQTSADGFGGGGVTIIPPGEREEAPDVVGEQLGGGRTSITDWAGRSSIVNIWASWCGPCRKEAPELVDAATSMPDVRFLGVTVRDNASAAEAFEANHRIPYPSVQDPDGQIVLGFHGLVNPSALPYTIVVDSQGRIGAVIAGATTSTTLEGVVQDVEQGT